MKEKRVYIVPTDTLDELTQDQEYDHEFISDDQWMYLAEEHGWVFTIEGFFKAWNDEMTYMFPQQEYSELRIIEVEKYGKHELL